MSRLSMAHEGRDRQEEIVRRDSGRWVRVVAGALAAIVSALAAAPVHATEPGPEALPARPLSTAVAARLAAMPAPALAAQEPAPAAGAGDRGFFRTPKGVAAVVLMAAGLGFTLYSIKNDRDPVKSPIR